MVAERVVSEAMIKTLREKLTDVHTTLPHKYRILFSLRNIKGEAAREALAAGLSTMCSLYVNCSNHAFEAQIAYLYTCLPKI